MRDTTRCGVASDSIEGFERQQLSHFLEEFFFVVKRNRRNTKKRQKSRANVAACFAPWFLCPRLSNVTTISTQAKKPKRDQYFDSEGVIVMITLSRSQFVYIS